MMEPHITAALTLESILLAMHPRWRTANRTQTGLSVLPAFSPFFRIAISQIAALEKVDKFTLCYSNTWVHSLFLAADALV